MFREKLEKLLKKIGKKEREGLLSILQIPTKGKAKGLKVRELKDSDFYHLRKGRFRIVSHHNKGEVIVDSVKLKGKGRYKNLD